MKRRRDVDWLEYADAVFVGWVIGCATCAFFAAVKL
jgi:hypothetical protein